MPFVQLAGERAHELVGDTDNPDRVAGKPARRGGGPRLEPRSAARACELEAAGQYGACPVRVPADERAVHVAADEEVAQPVLGLVGELQLVVGEEVAVRGPSARGFARPSLTRCLLGNGV
eukprot:14491797-Alexandrium_andersonii.AAC.1